MFLQAKTLFLIDNTSMVGSDYDELKTFVLDE